MIFFVLGILVAIAAIAGTAILKSSRCLLGLILAMLLVIASCLSSVPTGYTGILTTFGRVEDGTLEAGFHFKAPWQKVVTINNREQRQEFQFAAFSSDIQQVDIIGSVNYMVNKATAMNLYREVGTGYVATLIIPRVFENTKAVFSRYKAESLVANRNVLSDEICELLRTDLGSYGLNIISIAIEDVDFTDAFTNAVESKQVASQNKLRAETEQQQAIMEAKAAADRQVIAAEAQAQVAKIEADAQAYSISAKATAEAEANLQIAASLTEALINYVQAQSWNGELPATYVGGGEVIPVIQTARAEE